MCRNTISLLFFIIKAIFENMTDKIYIYININKVLEGRAKSYLNFYMKCWKNPKVIYQKKVKSAKILLF